jgi:hypothetical protein
MRAGAHRFWAAVMLVVLSGVSRGGYLITRVSPLSLKPGVAAYDVPPEYPLGYARYMPYLRAEVVSVAVGYALSDNAGVAIGTVLTEPFLVPGLRFPYPSLYLYFVSHAPPTGTERRPAFVAFAGAGMYSFVYTGETRLLARLGCRLEWRLGPATPGVELAYSSDYYWNTAVSLSAGIGLWGWRSHSSGEPDGALPNSQ